MEKKYLRLRSSQVEDSTEKAVAVFTEPKGGRLGPSISLPKSGGTLSADLHFAYSVFPFSSHSKSW